MTRVSVFDAIELGISARLDWVATTSIQIHRKGITR